MRVWVPEKVPRLEMLVVWTSSAGWSTWGKPMASEVMREKLVVEPVTKRLPLEEVCEVPGTKTPSWKMRALSSGAAWAWERTPRERKAAAARRSLRMGDLGAAGSRRRQCLLKDRNGNVCATPKHAVLTMHKKSDLGCSLYAVI